MALSTKYLSLRDPNIPDLHNNELLQECLNDESLMAEVFIENKNFAYTIIRRYRGDLSKLRNDFRVTNEELLQHAYLGMMYALRNFDFDKGVKFTTYVCRPILWEVNQLLFVDSHIVKLSRGCIAILKNIEEINSQLGYSLNAEELSQELNVPLKTIQDILQFTSELKSLDDYQNTEDNGDLSFEDEVMNKVYVEQLIEQAELTDFEKQVVDLLREGHSNSSIANKLGVFAMKINRTIERIRAKMEDSSAGKRLSKYEDEVKLVSEELEELGCLIDITEMADLLEVCGYSTEGFTARILYYIRNKALLMLPEEGRGLKECMKGE